MEWEKKISEKQYILKLCTRAKIIQKWFKVQNIFLSFCIKQINFDLFILISNKFLLNLICDMINMNIIVIKWKQYVILMMN